MATIRIERNEDGNCINFHGAANPTYFNACLSGEVDSTYTTRINVINDVRTAQGSETFYEFYQIPYTDLVDANGDPFGTPQEAADYITAQGNVLAVSGQDYLGVWDPETNTPTLPDYTSQGNWDASGGTFPGGGTASAADYYTVTTGGTVDGVSFVSGDTIAALIDNASTTTYAANWVKNPLPDAGDFYFASQAGSTSLGGESVWRTGDKLIWSGTAWQKLGATQLVDGITYSTLLDSQTSVFSGAEAPARDPNNQPGWYYTNTENNKINWHFYGDTPTVENELGDLNGWYAVVDFRKSSSNVNWVVYTRREDDGEDQGIWFRSQVTYSDSTTLQAAIVSAGGSGRFLVHQAGMDVTGIEPTLTRISIGTDSSATTGPQAADEVIYLMHLSTDADTPAGTNEFVVEKAGYILGNHRQEFQLSAAPAAGPSISDETPDSLDFTREDTNTTILTDAGDQWGVNSIHAVANGDGTLDIRSLPGNQVIYDSIVFGNVTIAGSSPGSTENAVVNALNALFAVQPQGAGGEYIPVHPVTETVDVTYTTAEGSVPITEITPGTPHLLTVNGTSGHDARLWSTETINQTNEYYLVRIIGNGRFIIGLADGTTDTDDPADGPDDLEELANNSGTAHSGLIWGQAFYDYGSYSAPWTIYGSSPSLSYGPGWNGATTSQMRYNTVVQNALTAGSGLGALFKIGIDSQGYIACWYYDEGRSNDFILCSRRNLTTPAGEYHLVVKLWDQNATLVEIPEIGEGDPGPGTATVGDSAVTLFGTATGDITTTGVTIPTAADRNDGFITTNDLVDAAGEYFEVTDLTGGKNYTIGLVFEDDHDVASITTLMSSPQTGDGPGYFLAVGVGTSGATGGVFREDTGAGYTYTTGPGYGVTGSTHFRVGIDLDGRAFVSTSTDGTNFTTAVRTTGAIPAGNYRFMLKCRTNGGGIAAGGLTTGELSAAITLNYRFIESPNGSFHYPLFASADEAAYVDVQNGGTAPGSAHAHVYVDEPTMATWYMPDNGGLMAQSAAPSNTAEIIYTEIPTNADNLYAPSQLTLSNQSAAENAVVNIPIQPVDQVPVAVVTGLPSPLVFQGGSIVGTTRYVTGDQTYTVTVERSNNYGTTTQTFDLTITDNTSLNTITGWTALKSDQIAYQPDNVPHYSPEAAFDFDLTLDQGTEFTWTQTNTNSATAGPGQYMQLGIVSSGVDKANDSLDGTLVWDLKTGFWDTSIHYSNPNGYTTATGWVSNTHVATGGNNGAVWKLSYEQDGADYKIVLYRNGVEVARSADAYTGNQTITVSVPEHNTLGTRLPAISKTNIGAGSTTPPAGFEDPLLAGTMASTTVLDDSGGTGAAVQLTETLEAGRRYIVPQTWIEANVLPFIAGSAASATNDEQFFFGVAKSTANWGSSIDVGHFHALFRVEGTSSNNLSTLFINGSASGAAVTINSTTDAFYDYAIEWDGTDLHVIACNVSDINNQPAVSNGGTFCRVATYSNFAAQGDAASPLELVMVLRNGAEATLTTSGLQEIDIPYGANDIRVSEISETEARFDVGNGPVTADNITLNAGYTYRFYLNNASIESGDTLTFETVDGTPYTTGVTTVGSHGDYLYYVQFAVPSDVPPIHPVWNGTDQAAVQISGSTYVVPVTGITLEGPAANQTGTNVMDAGDHGWISLDEQLSAGERLVMDNAFWTDFLAELNENTNMFAIGLKGDNWTNTKEVNQVQAASTGEFFKGDTYIVGQVATGNYIYFRIYSNGVASNQMLVNTTALHSTVCAFLEITNSGNNIRAAFGRNGDASVTQGDESTVAYADWLSYKGQTGDQGYGITSKDVVISFWTYSGGAIDGADIDWTGLSEISVPTPASTLTTPWTKALDFAGGSERLQQVTNDSNRCPLRMGGVNNNAAAPTTAGNTSNDSNARPWATAIVFKAHTYNDNQHVWNLGEGAGTTDDNIFLRRDVNRDLWFGWGRSGELNECYVGSIAGDIGGWWGVYIASNGTRLGSGHTAADIAAAFDIRMVDLQTGATGSNLSTATNWTSGSFGARMNRQFFGDMTIGGRGANRSFRGKVAAMVVTTLRRNVAMPTDAEISMMVRDPQQWMTDYKVGNDFRLPWQGTDAGFNWAKNDGSSSYATQVWLMGDGANDAYSQIRNNVWPATQNYTPMNMISMVSSDIETVNINGLT